MVVWKVVFIVWLLEEEFTLEAKINIARRRRQVVLEVVSVLLFRLE